MDFFINSGFAIAEDLNNRFASLNTSMPVEQMIIFAEKRTFIF